MRRSPPQPAASGFDFTWTAPGCGTPRRRRGISESDYAAPFDTISVCFSKALGAPVGSCLVGGRDFIARARRFKQQIGGGFRQAGIIAAGALHALRNHRSRLGEVHELARRFADGLAGIEGIEIDPASVETNIVSLPVDRCRLGIIRRAST